MYVSMKTFISALVVLLLAHPLHAQQVSNETINVGGLNRTYILVLPNNFDPAVESLPVMMWAHGGSGTAENGMEWEADFRPMVNSNRFIAVYPQAWPDFEQCTCWGYDLGFGETNGNFQIDLDFIDALINELVDERNADMNRMYFGGYSMGGSFTDVAQMSGKIAAVAPVAASMWYSTLITAMQRRRQRSAIFSAPMTLCPMKVAGFHQRQNNTLGFRRTSPSPRRRRSISVEASSIDGMEGEACHGVQHFRIQNGGHDHPPFTPEVVWEFVSQYSLDGVIECIGGCDGDFNGDGTRDVNDILQAIGSFGTDDGGDIDGDGDTDVSDILELLSLFAGLRISIQAALDPASLLIDSNRPWPDSPGRFS